jgi:hypothetical protein
MLSIALACQPALLDLSSRGFTEEPEALASECSDPHTLLDNFLQFALFILLQLLKRAKK